MSAVVILFGGCRQLTEPGPIDGVFVLRTVGTQQIPAVTAVVATTEFSLLADTITLRVDGSGEWRSTYSRRNLSSEARDTIRTIGQFDYRRFDATAHATGITCEPICTRVPDEAEFRIDGEWLTWGFEPSLYRYERIAENIAL